MRAARHLVPPLLALLAAAFVLLHAAGPAGAAQRIARGGTAEWVALEQMPAKAKAKGKRQLGKAKRATPSVTKGASARGKGHAAKRAGKPRRRGARAGLQATLPRAVAPTTLLPNDPLWRNSWALTKVNVPAAWSLTTGGPETVVAVLDTGVDMTHPDLQGAFVPGYDTVNEDADASDDHGHGTMVAGIIAARGNNGIGIAGACWRCSVMPVKVIGGDGLGSAADVAEGIVWATDHGARVINMSFTMSEADAAVAAAVEHARSRDVILVAAAGNTGTSVPTFPSAFSGVLSVAGTDAADARYEWSSYGGWVRLAAPGCNLTTSAGGSYGDFCGTSSATAFVSGLAGLARALAPALPAAPIGDSLASHAVKVGDFVSAGRVDATAALGGLRPSP